MIGSIVGDIVGSIYEHNNIKTKDFPLFSHNSDFTDDTICTIAFADCILNDGDPTEYLQKYCRKYNSPMGGYGGFFKEWFWQNDPKPYNSFGNGAAMRISPIAYSINNYFDIKDVVEKFTAITHNHEEGLKGAKVVSWLTHLLLRFPDVNQNNMNDAKNFASNFYNLNLNTTELRYVYEYNETCQGTVPEAIMCFLDSNSFEDAIRNAVSIGGDTDTLACITGGIAQAYYKEIPSWIIDETYKRLPPQFISIIEQFNDKFNIKF